MYKMNNIMIEFGKFGNSISLFPYVENKKLIAEVRSDIGLHIGRNVIDNIKEIKITEKVKFHILSSVLSIACKINTRNVIRKIIGTDMIKLESDTNREIFYTILNNASSDATRRNIEAINLLIRTKLMGMHNKRKKINATTKRFIESQIKNNV